MNTAKQEAKRVYDHCASIIGPEVLQIKGITVERLAQQIREGVTAKMNEKFIADTMIKTFDIQWKNLKE